MMKTIRRYLLLLAGVVSLVGLCVMMVSCDDDDVTPGGGGSSDTHEYVDLGLPSGTLWATCNIGANSPEEYGDYFAWGETTVQDSYEWGTYQWCEGSYNTLTKYCNDDAFGYNGFTDDPALTELVAGDDAATANWGVKWRMPTIGQFEELINSEYTETAWTTENGVNGCRITSKSNGKSIFLPAAGYRQGGSLYCAGSDGYYWSRTLGTNTPDYARALYLDSGCIYTNDYYDRNYGRSVRPVRAQ